MEDCSQLTGYTVCLELFAEKELATTAVEALHAEFRVIGDNTVPKLEILDVFAHSGNDTDGLMSYSS
jgi:hypothetical protein